MTEAPKDFLPRPISRVDWYSFPAVRLSGTAVVAGAATLAALSGCRPMVDHAVDLHYATARAATQTAPATVAVTEADLPRPYHVLGDITVRGFKVGAFGQTPTHELLAEALRVEAARLGADAVILVRYGVPGMGTISYSELEARGRAVRY